MKTYLLLISCVVLLFSCDEQETMLFKDKHEIYFNHFFTNAMFPGTQAADSTIFSFFFYPETMPTVEAKMIVHLSGPLLTSDLKFQVRVVEEETTANPNEYTIDEYYVFRANKVGEHAVDMRDTIGIKLNRSSRLENMPEGVRLVVELVPNEEIGLGQIERTRAKIIITNNTAKPEWWTDEVKYYLLGDYSQKKYKLFLEHVDKESIMNGDFIKNRPDEARKMIFQFKKWLNEQKPAITEENGTLMVVSI